MTRSSLKIVVTAGILAVGTLGATSAARAAQPTQADIDFCNQQAAAATAQGTASPTPGQPGSNPTGGRITDSTMPGAVPTPSAQPGANPKDGRMTDSSRPGTTTTTPAQPGSNPTGGRITDSSVPGMTPSQPTGMSPAGETSLAYKQAYLSCIKQRS